MNESHKYNETDSCVVYKQEDEGMKLSMCFNKDMKTVDINLLIFVRNGEPMLEPMDAESDWIRHSAKYGHWQQIFPTLGVEDVEFLYKKAKELFGKD